MGSQSTTNEQSSFVKFYNNLFAIRRSKIFLFFGTLLLEMIIVALLGDSSDTNDIFGTSCLYPFSLLTGYSGALLTNWLFGNFGEMTILAVLFIGLVLLVAYVIIMAVGIRSNNLKLSKVLFLIFVFLLILNIAGSALIET